MQTEVLIVGAGPSGLVLALWLARLGVRVRIIDRAAGPGASPRAFALQARTLELYDRLGLAQDAMRRGRPISAMNVHYGRQRGQPVPFGAFGRGLSPFPYVLMLMQDDHEKLLIDHLAAAGVKVERKTELIDLDDRGDKVRARLKGPRGGDKICEAAFVCGCDGAGSVVRQLLGIEFPGQASAEIFYVADVEAKGALADGELHYVMGEGELCSVFPRRGRGRLRLIGLTPPSVRSRLSQFGFEDLSPQIQRDTNLEVSVVESFATYPVHQRIAKSWRKGRVFLLGDASHIHSPAGGQGLNAGVGDAANLAWKLGAVLRGGADPGLLDTYQSERQAVARQIAATTDRGFALQAQRGPGMALVRSALARLAPELMRVPAFGRWAFRTISQVGVHYRSAGACAGRAGRVSGGDRLPWVRLDPGADNYGALEPPFPIGAIPATADLGAASQDGGDLRDHQGAYVFTERALGFGWQAQVYGQVSGPLGEACAEWGLTLKVFPWRPDMKRAGLARNAVYLIRPDGYVAFASRRQDPIALAAHLQRFEIRFRSAPASGGVLHAGLGAPEAPAAL